MPNIRLNITASWELLNLTTFKKLSNFLHQHRLNATASWGVTKFDNPEHSGLSNFLHQRPLDHAHKHSYASRGISLDHYSKLVISADPKINKSRYFPEKSMGFYFRFWLLLGSCGQRQMPLRHSQNEKMADFFETFF